MCAQRVLGYCRKTVRPAIKNVEHGDKMSPTFLELSIREQEAALKFKIMTTEVMSGSNQFPFTYLPPKRDTKTHKQQFISSVQHTYYSEGQRDCKIVPALNAEKHI